MGIVAIFVAAVFLTLLAFRFLFPPYQQQSSSMEPAIRRDDMVFMKRTGDVHRGDIVVVRYPLNKKTSLIKRVIGMPCDVVEIRAKQLILNGKPIEEPYVIHDDAKTYSGPDLKEPYRSRDYFGPYTVLSGEYFLLGDNREHSSDSRYWGAVPSWDVRGRVVLIMTPGSGFSQPQPPPVLASVPPCRSTSPAPPATPATTPAR